MAETKIGSLALSEHQLVQLTISEFTFNSDGISDIDKPDGDQSAISVSTSIIYALRNDDDQEDGTPANEYRGINLVAEFLPAKENENSYAGKVVGFGVFSNETLDSNEFDEWILSVGAVEVYNAIREYVKVMTANGPHGQITLPSMSFSKE